MMLWTTVPLIVLTRAPRGRVTNVLIWMHVFLCAVAHVLYCYFRAVYARNLLEPSLDDEYVQRTHEFYTAGCKMLLYRPRSARRRVLLFPGLSVSVRRMLREPGVRMLLPDTEILCFQVRGLGESDLCVDISTTTMLQDSVAAYGEYMCRTNDALPSMFVGYSLGTFVAMQLVSHLGHLVGDTTSDDIPQLGLAEELREMNDM